jgi:hypothetical protein
MSQPGKTLWIAGDSYGTFDKTDGTHWLKQFAYYHNCDRIFNLSRGGFDSTAITYTAGEIISNNDWPGRGEDRFEHSCDILVVIGTTPGRFCYLRDPYKQFDYELSIANLNWHTPYLEEQVPMPWIAHMPEDSNMFSQTYNSIIGEHPPLKNNDQNESICLDLDNDAIQHLEETVVYQSHQWDECLHSQQLAGVVSAFESRADGAQLFLTHTPYHMEQVAKYILPDAKQLLGESPLEPNTLINHLTAQQHNDYFDKLLDHL